MNPLPWEVRPSMLYPGAFCVVAANGAIVADDLDEDDAKRMVEDKERE